MNHLKSLAKTLSISAALLAGLTGSALAQDSYIPNLQNSFVGWCAGQSYSAKVCKCAVSQAAVQIPATAMASFLAAADSQDQGQITAALSTSVGVSTVQILTTCSATSSGSGSGGMLNGLFGN